MLIAATLLPFAVHMCGPLYLAGALLLGAGSLYGAIQVMRGKDKNAPMANFKFSNIYLMLIFIIMLIDHYLFPQMTIATVGA
jgi:protoheme IX farnesyltransferase